MAALLSLGPPLVVLAGLLSAASLVPLLRWPSLGLPGLVVASLLVPFSLGTGSQTRIPITVFLLAALCALWLVEKLVARNLAIVPSRTVLPLLAFCGIAIVAFLEGMHPWLLFAQTAPIRSQIGGLALFLLSAAAFLLAANQVRSSSWLQALTWTFIVAGGLYVLARAMPESAARPLLRLFQPSAMGSLFWVWLASLGAGQAVFNDRLHPLGRLAAAIVVALTLGVAILQVQAWASGWVPPLVAVIATLVAGNWRLGLPIALAAGVSLWMNPGGFFDVALGTGNQYSMDTRVEAWRVLEPVIAASPVLGLGPSNYYFYTPLFPILGYAVNFNSHNQYVDLVAQVGLPGLACFLWFAWEAGRVGWRLRASVDPGFQRAYVCGALGGLAGTLVAGALGDWVIPFVYNIGYDGFRASVLGWLFLGGLVALGALTRKGGAPARTQS